VESVQRHDGHRQGHRPAALGAAQTRGASQATRDPLGMMQYLRNVELDKDAPKLRPARSTTATNYTTFAPNVHPGSETVEVPGRDLHTASKVTIRIFEDGVEKKDRLLHAVPRGTTRNGTYQSYSKAVPALRHCRPAVEPG